MRKTTLIFFSAALFWCACNHKSKDSGSVSIHGKIKGYEAGQLVLNYFTDSIEHHDTVQIANGEFNYTGKVNSTTYYYLVIPDAQAFVDFFADGGEVEINGRIDSLNHAKISGSESQETYELFKDHSRAINDESERLNYAYYQGKLVGKPKEYFDSLDGAFNGLEKKRKATAAEFIQQHSSSPVSAWIILNNFFSAEYNELEPLYSVLDGKIKTSPYGEEVESLVKVAKSTQIGVPAPDFNLNDTSNQAVSMSAYSKGSVTLIDFWASWCDPCRRDNPGIVRVYSKLNAQGFKILGVSLDEEKGRWMEAIRMDGLTWAQVADLKGWKNVVAKQYGVRSLPANFLLDRTGKIIAKNLHGEELESKVTEALAAKP